MFGFYKKKDKETLVTGTPAPINITNTMNLIDSAVLNHLTMKTNGALMLTGDWGSGKTYYMKTKLFPEIKTQTKLKPIIVSVYGAKDKESIAQKVVFSFWDRYANNKFSIQKITQSLTKLAAAIPAFNKYVNIEKILTANGENLLKLLPHDEVVIFFDDVERISDKLDINDFLGLVNELVENSRAKVILVANAKKFSKPGENDVENKKLIYLEKTVEKTVHYITDMPSVLGNIFEEYQAGPYQDFLKKHKDWLLETLTVGDDDANLKALKIELVNIRTIKFAVEHFRLVFEAVTKTKQPQEKLVEEQLQSAWLFVIGLSVAFRSSGEIAFDNTNHLEEPEPTLANLDIDFTKVTMSMSETSEEEPQADPQAFAKRFKREFYIRLNQTYRFYNEIFRLVTGGQAIDAVALCADLDQQFYTNEGKTNPAQTLIDKFVSGGWWRFNDAEFKPALEQLMAYSEDGEFGNPVSYLNASVFLLGFKDIIGKTEAEIVSCIEHGLDKYFDKTNYNLFIETQFDMTRGHFNDHGGKELVDYMRKGFKRLKDKTEKAAATLLENLFIEDLERFVKEVIQPTDKIRTPYEPVFNFFRVEAIDEGLAKWEPSALMDLASLIELRYGTGSFLKKLVDEQPFLEKLKEILSGVKAGDKPLSVHIIHQELLPKVQKAINVLSKIQRPAIAVEAAEAINGATLVDKSENLP
jgi:hypothetical protein